MEQGVRDRTSTHAYTLVKLVIKTPFVFGGGDDDDAAQKYPTFLLMDPFIALAPF